MRNFQRYRATGLRTTLRSQGRMQRWLAHRIGFTESHVSNIISGRRTIDAERASRIATELNVPLDQLFEIPIGTKHIT